MNKPTIAIMGCGWLGLPLGASLVQNGYVVKGSTTTDEKLLQLREAGISPFLIQVEKEGLTGEHIADFFQAEVLVLNIPPGRRQGDVMTRFPKQVKAILEAGRAGTIRQVLFVSSTSVYPSNNEMVTEQTPLAPATDSGEALVQAEKLVENASFNATILRMAGLAGGNRRPGRFFAGRSGLQDGDVPVNFVHRNDAVEIIEKVIEQSKWGQVFNVCADEHPLKRHFYPARAKKLGLNPPAYSTSSDARFKTVSNEKVKTDLGYSFKYPDPMLFP